MKTLNLDVSGKTYPIVIGKDFIFTAASWEFLKPTTSIVIITQASIAQRYLSMLKAVLQHFPVLVVLINEGENYKNLNTVTEIADKLQEAKIPRDALLIALGGGIVGDITGFVASIYQRGVDFIQVPTTLLAQVDASVGGKTGVNLGPAKNMLGTFYQPERVLIDVTLLKSLPAREYAAGLAEILKYGLILDPVFLQRLLNEQEAIKAQDQELLIELIYRSCELKAAVVKTDEHDYGRRMILNFGHTFAHALESYYDYTRFLHGEAVALGLLLALKLGAALGFDDNNRIYPKVKNWLAVQGLPYELPTDLHGAEFIALMALDKKKVGARLRFIILETVGRTKIVENVPESLLQQILTAGL